MKNRYIKTITYTGLLAVLALQLIWAYNAYSSSKEEIQRKGGELLDTAMREDVTRRIKTVPLPKEGVLDDHKDGSSISFALLNEVYESLSAPLSLHYIDSTYKSLAAEENFLFDYHWVVYEGKFVKSDSRAKFDVYSWGELQNTK
ncbi:hypothetical protein [Bacteroides sp. 519]|uniref:hypothetical protein n=1 Tax=Bacteroides sp. 519 TaxID=2302937 RepID=UPI0013D866F8|nr:hypothetical protein [Bacteroides sp. 519]NDV57534.1 hypothetical protein [Bacteroides sp. 519]